MQDKQQSDSVIPRHPLEGTSSGRERTSDVLLQEGIAGEILDGTKDLLWRPIDDRAGEGPYLLKSFPRRVRNLKGQVVTEERAHEMTDAEGEQVGTAAFFSVVWVFPEET